MKKLKSVILLLAVLTVLSSVFAVAASAAEDQKTEIVSGVYLEDTMQFCDVEVEYSGLNGIRALFSVKDAEIAKIEAAGGKVTYGALVGYRATYHTDPLLVDSTKNAGKLIAYANGQKTDGCFFESDESGVSKFAIATFFGSKAEAADANRGLIYRGFIEVAYEGQAEPEIFYLDVAQNASTVGPIISVCNAYRYFVTTEKYFNVDIIPELIDRVEKPTVIYVNPNAAASGDGLTAATAVVSVNEGYAKAVELINASGAPIDVVIELAPGKHFISDRVHIKGDDITSTYNYSITFRGSKSAEKSVVTSNVDIAAGEFQNVSGKRYYEYQLPESAKIGGKYPAFRDLYIDGDMCTLATSKGMFSMFLDSCRNADEDKNNPDWFNANDRLLYVSIDALGDVAVDADGNVIGDLEFWIQTDWQVHCVHIEHIDYSGTELIDTRTGEMLYAIRVEKGDWDAFKPAYYSTLKNCRYWFQNNQTYLDDPGEFWYDEANGKIYIMPFRNMQMTKTVSYPVGERLFYLDEAKNITFQNLDLTGTTMNYITNYGYVTGQGGYVKREWTNPDTGLKEERIFLPYGAIYGKHVENIRIDECSFYSIGADAVYFEGVVDFVRIYDSSFEIIGSCAIRLGTADRPGKFNSAERIQDIVIRENFMQNIALSFNSSTAIFSNSVKNMEITQNTILDTAYSAISVGWNWGGYPGHPNVENTKIEYNYIENFMTKTQDGGAIYTLGGNAPQQNSFENVNYKSSMSHNYVVLTSETGNGEGHFTVFYHDQGSSHWLDEGNILIAGPDAQGTDHTYNSFQSISPGVNNIKNDGFIFIGEFKEGNPYKDETQNDDGSKNYVDSALASKYNEYVNWWRFESFAAMAGTEQEAVVIETAAKAGCSSYKPVYGEWSAKK